MIRNGHAGLARAGPKSQWHTLLLPVNGSYQYQSGVRARCRTGIATGRHGCQMRRGEALRLAANTRRDEIGWDVQVRQARGPGIVPGRSHKEGGRRPNDFFLLVKGAAC